MKKFLIRVAQLLFKLAMEESLRRVLPKVYERLDQDLPQVLSMKPTPIVVESVVAQAISAATEKRATVDQIEAVIGLYDPIRSALRNIKR